jgi:hypothetical protein
MVSLVVNVEQLNADAALSRWDREPFITERYRAASTKDACLEFDVRSIGITIVLAR